MADIVGLLMMLLVLIVRPTGLLGSGTGPERRRRARVQGTTHGWRFWAVLAGVYAVLVVLPHLLSFSQKEVAVFLVINVLVVVSYRLLTLTGEWSLAHVVIMGVGAYASTLLAKRLGVPVPPAMLLGAASPRSPRTS